MRVLVLGGNRYIGLHLVFELARRGHDVTVLNSHVAPLPEGARRLHGDRQQPGVLHEVLGPHRDEFDAVFDNTAYHVERPRAAWSSCSPAGCSTSSSPAPTAVYRRNWVQPVLETFRDPRPGRHGAGRRPTASARCSASSTSTADHEEHGFPYTGLRVAHTIGPRSPLVTREPIFFDRLEQGRPDPDPGRGLPVRPPRPRGRRGVADGVDHRQRPRRRPDLQRLGAEYTSLVGCVRLMAGGRRRRGRTSSTSRSSVARTAVARRSCTGARRCIGGIVFRIDKALHDLDWTPRFGLADGYRDSYDWFAREGRDRYEYDFSLDDEVLALLGR